MRVSPVLLMLIPPGAEMDDPVFMVKVGVPAGGLLAPGSWAMAVNAPMSERVTFAPKEMLRPDCTTRLPVPEEAVTEFENKVSALACRSTEPEASALARVAGEIVLSPLTANEADETGSAPPVAIVRLVAADPSSARSGERQSENAKVFMVISLLHNIWVI